MFYRLDGPSSQPPVLLCYLLPVKIKLDSQSLPHEPLPNLIGESLADCSFVAFWDETWLWGVAGNPTDYACEGWRHMLPASFQRDGPTPLLPNVPSIVSSH